MRLYYSLIVLFSLIFRCKLLTIDGRLLNEAHKRKLSVYLHSLKRCKYENVNVYLRGVMLEIDGYCTRESAKRYLHMAYKFPIKFNILQSPASCNGKLVNASLNGMRIRLVVRCGLSMVNAVSIQSRQGFVCINRPCEGGYYGRGWKLKGNFDKQWIGILVAVVIIVFIVLLVAIILYFILRRKKAKDAQRQSAEEEAACTPQASSYSRASFKSTQRAADLEESSSTQSSE
ncbi:hypothetical protein Tcan_09532 [Toxocara canis]|uniref:Uncharacterized protein n=1 Tax=Toxocara canis TaxID=6265 RepID=A0A0B2VT77_TOXCA|nr:hypothetical protein Tcan_09532 [Toxocara canis]